MNVILHGVAVGGGIAIGRAHLVVRGMEDVPQIDIEADDIAEEVVRFEAAIKVTRRELEQLRSTIPENAPTELGAFISLHLMLLTDVTLSREPIDIIEEQAINAEWALKLQTEKLAEQFDAIDDEYLRERKQDMLQVAERIYRNLVGLNTEPLSGEYPDDDIILVAHDLAPADMVSFKERRVAGFATDIGGPTSHTAILGRSLDMPSVVGLHNARDLIAQDEWLIIDGINGVLIIAPDECVLAEYRKRDRLYRSQKRLLNKLKDTPATTQDGHNIELFANIESAGDIRLLHKLSAEGVGLFRSEFLFLNRDTLPDEEEQYRVYSGIVKKLKGKALTIRTVDLGVDKNPRWFGQYHVLNPALGLTGIRLCLAEPVMFRTQMRAILRAATHGPVKLMWPMISSIDELRQCHTHLNTARKQLDEAGLEYGSIEVGAMIEIPSAALTVNSLLKHLDFISIGTNDLIQYTLSVDRGDDSVSHLYQPEHPAVLKLLHHVLEAAFKAGKPVSVCGEMGGDIQYTRLLLGLGLRRFSMNAANLLAVKNVVIQSDCTQLAKQSKKILRLEQPEDVRRFLKKMNREEEDKVSNPVSSS